MLPRRPTISETEDVREIEIPGTELSVEAVVQQARAWVHRAAQMPPDPAAQRLAAMLEDPQGLAFAVAFIDGVIRPEDATVAAQNLRRVARRPPAFLPLHLRLALQAGALIAPALPRLTIPIARRMLRRLVAHLVIDARDSRLGSAITRLRADGTRLNLNLLGEAVLGRAEADRRLERIESLVRRADVDYVSVKVSAAVPPHSPWGFDEAVAEIQERLLPLMRAAARERKFINLDMEEYRDLDLTLAVFTQLLDREELMELEAGIALQAYLPDALGAMIQIQEWAQARVERGGARVKVRLVKGANLPMELVESELRGWPLATWSSKRQSDTNYKRVLEYALIPERVANVRIGVASHNLFDVAFAHLLAEQRGVSHAVEFEMLLGMASAQARAVSESVGPLRLYTPVVHPAEFDVAIAYLVRRLEEVASHENYLSAAFSLARDERLFERERDRFIAAAEAMYADVPEPQRSQDRSLAAPGAEPADAAFTNAPDSDPASSANRHWARAILARVPDSRLGAELADAATVTDPARLEQMLADAQRDGAQWSARSGGERAAILRRAAEQLERRRGELIEVMAAECGKTVEQADPEVSEAVDFARYYADRAIELDQLDGAAHTAAGLTLVCSPWNFPVSIPCGSTLGPLAAGSPVVIKPAPQAQRCAAVLVQALWDAGVPRTALHYVNVGEDQLGRALVSDPRIHRLVLTGAYETAALFRSWRNELPLLAETSGKNSIIVMPSADPDLAVRDIVQSAFGNAGQKCSATSLAILVGSVAGSRRFRRQLVDAVSSLHVALPQDPRAQMGPLIGPASGKLEQALTRLGPGERWLVTPRRLDAEGRLWTPGVKSGVQRGSEFHRVEYFGPVLGLIEAVDLEQAIAIQNEVEYGLTAGLHSLQEQEIARWLNAVQAGNVYVNRGTTGAIVRRQPFGGWKRSVVGAGAKAGGPNYLIGLSDWEPRESRAQAQPTAIGRQALQAAEAAGLETPSLQRALRSDAQAWSTEYGVDRDASGLRSELNVLRYLPVPVEIRLDGDDLAGLLRVAAAGAQAGAPASVSVAQPLPDQLSRVLAGWRIPVLVQSREDWLAGLRTRPPGRLRLLGEIDAETVLRAAEGRPDITVHDHPVTESGRLELLVFLHEQAVSVCTHRFGSPLFRDPVALGLRPLA